MRAAASCGRRDLFCARYCRGRGRRTCQDWRCVMASLDAALLAQMTAPAPRLPQLERWLTDQIWSASAFERAGRSPKAYLLAGEREVNERESLFGATAGGVYHELAQAPRDDRTIAAFFA